MDAKYTANGIGKGDIMDVRYWKDTPATRQSLRDVVLCTLYKKDSALVAPRFAALYSSRNGGPLVLAVLVSGPPKTGKYPMMQETPPAASLRSWVSKSCLVVSGVHGRPESASSGSGTKAFNWPTEWRILAEHRDFRLAEAYPHGLLVQSAHGLDAPYVYPEDGPRNLPRSADVLATLLAAYPDAAQQYSQANLVRTAVVSHTSRSAATAYTTILTS